MTSVHPGSNAVSFILQPGSTSALPQDQLTIQRPQPKPPTLAIEGIMGTSELEETILDVDGRVSRVERHAHFTAELGSDTSTSVTISPQFTLEAATVVRACRTAKCFRIWRWSEEMRNDVRAQLLQDRGGREIMGTAFYLRCT